MCSKVYVTPSGVISDISKDIAEVFCHSVLRFEFLHGTQKIFLVRRELFVANRRQQNRSRLAMTGHHYWITGFGLAYEPRQLILRFYNGVFVHRYL